MKSVRFAGGNNFPIGILKIFRISRLEQYFLLKNSCKKQTKRTAFRLSLREKSVENSKVANLYVTFEALLQKAGSGFVPATKFGQAWCVRIREERTGEGRVRSKTRHNAPEEVHPPSFLGATRAFERPPSSFSRQT